jgi:hypothetical protein
MIFLPNPKRRLCGLKRKTNLNNKKPKEKQTYTFYQACRKPTKRIIKVG